MKLLLQFILKLLARATLRKYHPQIIGVTGSVGKTSTRQAVAAVVATTFTVWQSPKNLNNEIGLPLSILGEADSGYNNPVKWLRIFWRGLKHLLIRRSDYPAYLVLEYGVDHPGDMAYLLSLARPSVAVLTAVAPTHLEFMGSLESLLKEEGGLVTGLPASGQAIINIDDSLVASLQTKLISKTRTYGFSESAEVRADSLNINLNEERRALGLSFKLSASGNSLPVVMPGTLGRPAVLAALAATATGLALNIPLLKIIQVLPELPLPAGRMRILSGIKQTTLIDDTYNSSPRAVSEALAALQLLAVVATHHKWAVLGDMLELGAGSTAYHYQIGQEFGKSGIDYLVAIGAEARQFIHGAVSVGFDKEQAWHFDKAETAAGFVKDRLQTGDVVLIKGSQGVRCEKVTKELLAQPEKAKELLVRQYRPWI
ncbi:MAG: hypothetical protein HY973_02720 [Candidatus Kerfeldbacteria bacterium]|nr:hypothetical protein [Candidatus Kerfeldbacteria bacterium]